MKKQQKSIVVLAIAAAFLAALFLPGPISAGDLEPGSPPGSTMKTLDQIPPSWSQKLPASERFELVLDGEAVLDKETGLVWAKNANLAGGTKTWVDAMNYCQNPPIGGRKGWRLPTVEELASLVDISQPEPPKVPPGVFDSVQSYHYWSSTTYEGDEGDSTLAWVVVMNTGLVGWGTKTSNAYVWPVRGGQ